MPYQTLTRQALREQLRARWEDTPFWDDDDSNAAINHTLYVWNLLTSYWRRRITVSNVADDPLVVIPGTLAQQTAVTWHRRPMTGVSVAELNMLASRWWQARVGDSDAPARPTFWAPIGLNLMAVYPAFTTVDTFGFEIDGVRATPILTTDNSLVDIGSEELDTLLGYMVHAVSIKAGGRLLERTQPGLKTFIEAAAQKNTRLKLTRWYSHFQKSGYSWTVLPPALTVGTPGPAGVPTPAGEGAG